MLATVSKSRKLELRDSILHVPMKTTSLQVDVSTTAVCISSGWQWSIIGLVTESSTCLVSTKQTLHTRSNQSGNMHKSPSLDSHSTKNRACKLGIWHSHSRLAGLDFFTRACLRSRHTSLLDLSSSFFPDADFSDWA